MKKLLLLALVVVAAWQASIHYPQLLHPQPYNEAVVRNRSGRGIERVRLIVGSQTFVRENLESGEAAVFPFRLNDDARFKVVWLPQGQAQGHDKEWSGGQATAGPLVQRHTITIDSHGVIYHVEKLDKPVKPGLAQ